MQYRMSIILQTFFPTKTECLRESPCHLRSKSVSNHRERGDGASNSDSDDFDSHFQHSYADKYKNNSSTENVDVDKSFLKV